MPYIKQERRDDIMGKSGKAYINIRQINSAGELNFSITMLIKEYLDINGISYQNVNEVIGVLECAKLELYRRVAAPYEEAKCKENSDVY